MLYNNKCKVFNLKEEIIMNEEKNQDWFEEAAELMNELLAFD